MRRTTLPPLIVPVLAIIGLAVVAQSAATAPPAGHIDFTSKQADRGRLDYIEHCAQCHGGDLHGFFGPALAGPDGNLQWQSPKQVWTYTIGQMPVGDSGGLPKDQYIDIMAYILAQYRLHPTNRPLSAEALQMNETLIGKLR